MLELLGLHGSWHSGLAGNKWVVDPKVQLQIWLLLSCRRVLHCWICSSQVTDILFLHFLLLFLLLFLRTVTLGCKLTPFVLLSVTYRFFFFIFMMYFVFSLSVYAWSTLGLSLSWLFPWTAYPFSLLGCVFWGLEVFVLAGSHVTWNHMLQK